MAGQPDPKPGRPADDSTSEQRREFRIRVLALDLGCIRCRPISYAYDPSPCEGPLHAHHVITQQRLRALGRADLLWDPRVGAAVCERHHRRHHNGREPIPVADLPARCRDLGKALGLAEFAA